MGKRILLLWNDRHEVYDLADAEYWIHRRIEKGPGEPDKAYIIEDEFNLVPIIDLYYKGEAEIEKREQEERDKREYARLKAKFAKGEGDE